MSWRAHPITVALRNVARVTGANRLLSCIVSGGRDEAAFEEAMLANVRQGDCAWDVGANIGVYTEKLAQKVGPEGTVFAFEPSVINRARLGSTVAKYSNVIAVGTALGETDAVMRFVQSPDALGAMSRLVFEEQSASVQETSVSGCSDPLVEDEDRFNCRVQVSRGDTLVASGVASVPNVVKIDTEGFELEVLHGMGELLREPALRGLFIEVHFGLLQERGRGDAPRQIEYLLHERGFRCSWVDHSHLVAVRGIA